MKAAAVSPGGCLLGCEAEEERRPPMGVICGEDTQYPKDPTDFHVAFLTSQLKLTTKQMKPSSELKQ